MEIEIQTNGIPIAFCQFLPIFPFTYFHSKFLKKLGFITNDTITKDIHESHKKFKSDIIQYLNYGTLFYSIW